MGLDNINNKKICETRDVKLGNNKLEDSHENRG